MSRVVSLVRNLGGALLTAGVVSEFCLYDVDAGNRVVIFDAISGVLPDVYNEGTHFKLPWQVRRLIYLYITCLYIIAIFFKVPLTTMFFYPHFSDKTLNRI